MPEYRCRCQEQCLEDQRFKLTQVPPPKILFDKTEYESCLKACPETAIVPQIAFIDDWLRINVGGQWPYGMNAFEVVTGPETFNDSIGECFTKHQQSMQKCQDEYFKCLEFGEPPECFKKELGCWLGAWKAALTCQMTALGGGARHLKDWFKLTRGVQTTCAADAAGKRGETVRPPPRGGPVNANPLPQCLLTAGVTYVEAAWPAGLAAAERNAACFDAYGVAFANSVFGSPEVEQQFWTCRLQAQAGYHVDLIEPGVARAVAEGKCVGDWLLLDVTVTDPALPYKKRAVCLGDYFGRLKGVDRAAQQQHRQCQAELLLCMKDCAPVETGTAEHDDYFCGGLCNMQSADCAGRVEREQRLLPRHQLCREEFPRDPRVKQPGQPYTGPFGHGRGLCQALCESTIRVCADGLIVAQEECRNHCCGNPDCLTACDERNVFKPGQTGCPEQFKDCVTACREQPGGQEGFVNCLTRCATRFEQCERKAGGQDKVCGKDNTACREICTQTLFPDCPDCGADTFNTSNLLLRLPEFYDSFFATARMGYVGCD